MNFLFYVLISAIDNAVSVTIESYDKGALTTSRISRDVQSGSDILSDLTTAACFFQCLSRGDCVQTVFYPNSNDTRVGKCVLQLKHQSKVIVKWLNDPDNVLMVRYQSIIH